MLGAETFQLAEVVAREELELHPVWADYDEPRDRDRILSWGVPPARLASELEKFEYCGSRLLFPVLELDPLPERTGLVIAATFTSPNGESIPGYLIDDRVFGVFVGGKELCFNQNLPRRAAAAAEELATALGRTVSELFPLRYAAEFSRSPDARIEGRLDAFWIGLT